MNLVVKKLSPEGPEETRRPRAEHRDSDQLNISIYSVYKIIILL